MPDLHITYYISGPMAGYPDLNFPAFQRAKDALTLCGYSVFSPHDVDHGETTEWADFLRNDIKIMMERCSGIILLRGWPQSKGSRLELATAVALNWPVLYFDGRTAHYCMNRGSSGPPLSIDAAHIRRQQEWSRRTFGPGPRTGGLIEHIREELEEIEAAPLDLTEWADVVMLALDGAWRAGHSPEAIIAAVHAKQERNERRTWPDWRLGSPDHKIKKLVESDDA